MSKSQELPTELQEKIKKLLREGRSARSIAAELGIHHSTVLRYKAHSEKPEDAHISESHEVSEDEWVISLPKTRIKTLEELLEHCKVDTAIWQVERFIVNKWEMAFVSHSSTVTHGKNTNTETSETDKDASIVPLFQVKAFLKKKRFEHVDQYIEENTRLRSQVEKLRSSLSLEKEMSKRLARNHAGYDELLDNVKSFTEMFGEYNIPITQLSPLHVNPVSVLNPGHSEDAVLLISDTHFGDKIRREDTSGFQEFDLEIAGNRMGYLIAKAKEILTIHRAVYPIDTLHIWFGGDIGNGELHDTHLSNELNMIEQVHFSYHMLKFAIEDLYDLVDSGIVKVLNLMFTVGNHMRMDVKMPYKLQAKRTFDWLIYQMLIDRFDGRPGISIKKDISPFIFENIRGHRHMFCHGMQVGYKNSPDAQGKSVSRFMTLARALFDSPQWRKENSLEGETFSRACIGDIHVPIRFPRFISNGSLNGQNELGVNWQLEPIPAGFQIFGVSDKHQETWGYFIDATSVQRDNPNAYCQFAQSYMENANR